MSICQQRAAPCNFRPREFWPSQTTTCPGLPPRSSIYLAARELCPKCPSEFSFAQLSPCSQNNPPLGGSEVSHGKRNLENLILGALCTSNGELWEVTLWISAVLKYPRSQGRKSTKGHKYFGADSSAGLLETTHQPLGDIPRRAGNVGSKRWHQGDCCPLGPGMAAPGWSTRWGCFWLAVGYC